MKNSTVIVIGGIVTGVIIVGTILFFSRKKKESTSHLNVNKKDFSENKENIFSTESSGLEREGMAFTREKSSEDIQERHAAAASYIKDAIHSIQEESDESVDDTFEVDPAHEELNKMLNEI